MSNVEHYFENLLLHSRDCIGEPNKKALSKAEQRAVEECATYVKHTLFNSGVLRCQDCYFFESGTNLGWCNLHDTTVDDYDFCSRGEKLEEQT